MPVRPCCPWCLKTLNAGDYGGLAPTASYFYVTRSLRSPDALFVVSGSGGNWPAQPATHLAAAEETIATGEIIIYREEVKNGVPRKRDAITSNKIQRRLQNLDFAAVWFPAKLHSAPATSKMISHPGAILPVRAAVHA